MAILGMNDIYLNTVHIIKNSPTSIAETSSTSPVAV
jgi:hypothetical protein